MKKLDWIDMLKLKFSWGKNGAQTISPYGTLSTVALAKDGGIPFYMNDWVGRRPSPGTAVSRATSSRAGSTSM